MSERPDTVEIFHDNEFGRTDVTAVHQGIEIVRELRPNIEIVNDRRMLRVRPNAALDTMRWPKFSADYNILVTPRSLEREKTLSDVIMSGANVRAGFAKADLGIAVVNTSVPLAVKTTTAHELGHLYYLKREGKKYDPNHPSHCSDPECLMYFEADMTAELVRLAQNGLKRVLERYGVQSPKLEKQLPYRNNEDFCDECGEQLARNAFFLAKRRRGEFVPDNFLNK